MIESAQSPVLFLGQEASRSENANEIAKLVNKLKIPVISTYQGAGVILGI